ncbi:MAG TPA: hypothetical protein VFQ77_13710 [Pseudonocardiaceae bacterium]|jgi:hypothetical protein|nr:hypothetical protein [Pseudonocardiaceae bacterium]
MTGSTSAGHPPAAPPHPRAGPPPLVGLGLVAATASCAVLAGVAAVADGVRGLALVAGVLIGVGLLIAAACQPIVATYLYLGTLPIVAGIDRGTLIPLVRPNEALLVVLLAGAGLGGYLRYCRGEPTALRPHPLEMPLAAFLLAATVWPITSLMLRGQTPAAADLAAVLPVCKLVAIYLLVRCTVVTEPQLVRCIRLIAWPGAVVAVIAVLQTIGFGPVVAMLEAVWTTDVTSAAIAERGTTTLSSPIATGDYIIFSLVLVICCGIRGVLDRRERLGLGLVLSTGVLASGQFSTWISAAVATVLILWRFPQLRRRAVRFLPMVPIIFAIGAPAVFTRLGGFADRGVPHSWLGRWDNLSTFYLPRFNLLSILLGVSPNPVLPAPETWRDVIYLEAGYLQFLWIGGIPLLLAFGWLSVAVLRRTAGLMDAPGALGAAASALWISWWFLLVLTVIDPHLTMRGIGDILFALMAITTGRISVDRPAWPTVASPLGTAGRPPR